MLTSLYFIIINLLYFPIIFIPFYIFSIIGPKLLPRFTRFWGRFVIKSINLLVTVVGAENVPEGPVVIASNHTSMIDIPLLLGYLPKHFYFVIKDSLFKVPLFGTILKRLGYFPLSRKNPRKAIETLKNLYEHIKSDNKSVLIFPEGTRNPEGKLQEFKRGMIKTSYEAQVPILPVALIGCNEIVGKKGMKVCRGPLKIKIGKVVQPPGNRRAEQDIVNQKVWQIINQLLVEG